MGDGTRENHGDRRVRDEQTIDKERNQTPIIVPALKKTSAYGIGYECTRSSRPVGRRLSFSDEYGESLTQVSLLQVYYHTHGYSHFI